jgi:phosphatidylglycerol---prolipoprotein diacylglyceryl transferase
MPCQGHQAEITALFPVLFEIRGFEIRSYGLLIAIGIIAGVYLAEKEIRRKGFPAGLMLEFIPYGIASGIVFSRIVYVLTHIEYFIGNPLRALNLRTGGLSYFGALAGGIIASIIFLKIRKFKFLDFADCSAVGLPVSMFFGRIGCFLNGCCHGVPSSAPWAVNYTSPRSSAPLNIPLHPSQLYEAAGNLIIFIILLHLRKKKYPSGFLFFSFLLLYSIIRLFLEKYRADTLALITSGFGWTHIFFAVIIFASAVFIIQILNKRGV